MTRYLNHPRRWLVLLVLAAGCGDDGSEPEGDPTGSLSLTTETTAIDFDADGYTVTVDGDSAGTIGPNTTLLLSDLAVGSYSLSLSGMAAHCDVQGDDPVAIEIVEGEQTEVTFAITCLGAGDISISTATSGPMPDPNGYYLVIDGVYQSNIGSSGTVILNAAVGTHVITVVGIAPNCATTGPHQRTVDVQPSQTAIVLFAITCVSSHAHRIVFASTRGTAGGLNDLELWSVRADGSDPIRLTNNALVDSDPTVSPDGSQVAFTRGAFGSGTSDVWVMNADGTGAVQVTTGAFAQSPDWSPDGLRIAYSRRLDATDVYDLVTIDPDGGNPVTVGSTDPARTTRRISPSWSPNSSRVAFGTDSSLNSIEPNGANEVVIRMGQVSHVDWSWATNRIVFNAPAEPHPTDPTLYGTGAWVVEANGEGLTQVYTTTANTAYNSPGWDSEGTMLVFSRIVHGSDDANIWTSLAHGGGASEVAGVGDLNIGPMWR